MELTIKKLDADNGLRCLEAKMKTKIFLAFTAILGAVIITSGCVGTVSDTKTPAMVPNRDSVDGRYQRPLDQVYQAAVQVVQNDGVLIKEFILHDTTNVVRSLQAKVNTRNVWIRVSAESPQITAVTVQARSGTSGDVDLAHELEKEIALKLSSE